MGVRREHVLVLCHVYFGYPKNALAVNTRVRERVRSNQYRLTYSSCRPPGPDPHVRRQYITSRGDLRAWADLRLICPN